MATVQQAGNKIVEMKIRVPSNFRDTWTKFCVDNGVDKHGQTQEAIQTTMDLVKTHGWVGEDAKVEKGKRAH